MLEALPWILLALAVGALLFQTMGVWASVRHKRRAPKAAPVREDLPPVSLLKPLKGLEEDLESNLRTFFEQDYPAPFEIVFATTEADDPALHVARRVAGDYPSIPVRFVLSDPDFGLNPKVSNLAGALGAARHELVLQSDANVRVRSDYLRRVVSELLDGDGALLTSMVVGVGERSLGAAMENLQLSAFISPGMCTALHVAGISCVVGKSMLFRKSELEEVGGLAAVRDILAEDFILGQRYEAQGKRVLLSCTTADNVNRDIGIDRFLARHSRWLKMRAAIHVVGFVADLFANPVALGFFAWLASGLDIRFLAALAGLAAAKLGFDAFYLKLARGHVMRLRHLLVAPIKDVLMGLVWIYAIFSRSVTWRGTRLRFGRESRLRPDEGALPVRVLRRVLPLPR